MPTDDVRSRALARKAARLLGMTVGLLLAPGCSSKKSATETYFARTIEPILQGSCVSTNTGANCHVTDPKGNALGNLSLASYGELIKRRDLLLNYGPYGQPALLLKNMGSQHLEITAYDGTPIALTSDIKHAGGTTLGPTSAGFATLRRWILDGAAENNAPVPQAQAPRTPCLETYPPDPDFHPEADPASPDYATFKSTVQPVVGEACAAGNCHGSTSNSLVILCAHSNGLTSDDVLSRYNWYSLRRYITQNVASSEILRRPLDPKAGGSYHEGGVLWATTTDPGYRAIADWATLHGPYKDVPQTRGFEFFAKRVQPVLVKKGCLMVGCHSPTMFHDYRLRAGSSGHFSAPTTLTNYNLSIGQVALESPDPNTSRIIAKNLLRADIAQTHRGLIHRGGALLDDAGPDPASPAQCDLTAAETGDLDAQRAYCVLVRWIQIEREERKPAPLSGAVFVRRPIPNHPDLPQDFERFSPGADLCFTELSLGTDGQVAVPSPGSCRSLLRSCSGLDRTSSDVRHPTVSWKGDQVAFAARASEPQPWKVWRVNVDGTGCAPDDVIGAAAVDAAGQPLPSNGLVVHDFDPAFAPDGRLIFTSTRGNTLNTSAFDYQGPQHSPADPSKLNANLYVLEGGKVRQLTFLLNQELFPALMSDGRLIFSTEKRAPDFYELAGRRQNLDGGDYHPLFSQRRTIGYEQVTEVVELANKNFAGIFSDRGVSRSAGTLGIINRSLGVDHQSTDPADYVADKGALDRPDPKLFLHSLRVSDPAATGKPTGGSAGAYRSPTPLPNGDILVSYAVGASDLTSFTSSFDLWIVDGVTGERKVQVSNDPADEVYAVAVYERVTRGVFRSRPDEPNAHTRVYAPGEDASHPTDRADITVLNAPLLGSLIFQNTRTGRPIAPFDYLDVYEDLPPPLAVTNFDAIPSPFAAQDRYGKLYARRRIVGRMKVLSDGSAHITVPGGMPLVLAGQFQLEGAASGSEHFQREEMQFYPGEWAHQSFRRELFDGLCAGCHGSISGAEVDAALKPDLLTQASQVEARTAPADNMLAPPAQRGTDRGPPY